MEPKRRPYVLLTMDGVPQQNSELIYLCICYDFVMDGVSFVSYFQSIMIGGRRGKSSVQET